MVTTRSTNWLFSASRPPSRPPRPPRSPRPWPRSPRSPRRAPPRRSSVVAGAAVSVAGAATASVFDLHHVLFVIFGHSDSPPSRAPSATAAIRPWYLLPPRSKTTASIPAALARSATSSPTRLALAVLSPSNARRSASSVEALATVRPLVSSTTWTNTWRAERLTTRRGRTAVPEMRLRIRSWRRLR